MNKSTIFTAVAFLGCSLVSFGQQTTKDIGLSSIDNMQNNMTVYPNVPIFPQYSITNYGATTVLQSDADSIYREFFVDGVRRTKRGVNLPTAGITSGNTASGYTALDALDWGSYGLSPGNNSVCGKTQFWKNGMLDANSSNDETCIVVKYSASNYTYDVQPTNLQISAPPYAPGAYIPIPTYLGKLSFDLVNAGTNDLLNGLNLTMEVTIDGGAAIPVSGPLPTSVSSPGSISLEINMALGTQLPLTAGAFDVCLEMTNADDINSSNDKTCVTYNMGNPAAVAEVDSKVYGDVSFNNNTLNINFNEIATGISTVTVFEVSGREVGTYNLNVDQNKNQKLDMNSLNSGVHIANIMVNGELITYKFVKE